MENSTAEVEELLWEGDDTASWIKPASPTPPAQEPLPRGPFTTVGATLDTLLTQPGSRASLVISLVLALFFYLIMWCIIDFWHLGEVALNQARKQIATTAVLPITSPTLTPGASLPTPTVTSGATPTPGISSKASVLPSTSPPALFCGGMACGAIIVLVPVLAFTLVRKKRWRGLGPVVQDNPQSEQGEQADQSLHGE